MADKLHLPLLQFAPWSPSKADLAASCPLAFKFRYVDKVRSGHKGSAARIGTVVHRAQELVFEGQPVKQALDSAIAEDADLTFVETDAVRTFAHALQDFKKKVEQFSVRHVVTEQFLEQKWAITADFEPCDYFDDNAVVRGIVDMGFLLQNNNLVILDHKSGKLRSIQHYGTQLDIYTIMAQAHYPQVLGVQCALNFLAYDRVVWGAHKTSKYIQEVLRPWLINYLNDRATMASTHNPRVGRHCKWCDYRDTCPSWSENNERERKDE